MIPIVREAVRASVKTNVIAALQSAVDQLARAGDFEAAATYQRHLDAWEGVKPEREDDVPQVRHLRAVPDEQPVRYRYFLPTEIGSAIADLEGA